MDTQALKQRLDDMNERWAQLRAKTVQIRSVTFCTLDESSTALLLNLKNYHLFDSGNLSLLGHFGKASCIQLYMYMYIVFPSVHISSKITQAIVYVSLVSVCLQM